LSTFNDEDHEDLAALVYLRYRRDEAAARAAWSRMLENHGWDDDLDARAVWIKMVRNGLQRRGT
jgi:hypothetical protein